MAIKRIEMMKGAIDFMKSHNLKPNVTALAREYGVDRRTVQKILNNTHTSTILRNRNSELDPYKEIIKEKLSIHRTSIRSVFEYIVKEYKIETSYSNFRQYVKKYKLLSKKSNKAHPRYETLQGELIQVDWKEDIRLHSRSGEIFVINIFHMLLKFSRYSYIELTIKKERSDVIRCLINGFKYFGGVSGALLFDNMSTVVDVGGRNKSINGKILQFAKDFNFTVKTCKVRAGYTKGSNEARNKILDWIRPYDYEFDTIDDLIEIVKSINDKMNMNICKGTSISPQQLFYLNEKKYLNPLPNKLVIELYLTSSKVKVSNEALVYYKGNKYSVDCELINEYVSLETFNNQLHIYYKSKLVTIHYISDNPLNYHTEHYKNSLSGKVKESNIDKIAMDNLNKFDQLLNIRTISSINKATAFDSIESFKTYLLSISSTRWLINFYLNLSSNEKELFYKEVKRIMPLLIDDKLFFDNLKLIIKIDKVYSIQNIRFNTLIMHYNSEYELLNDNGFKVLMKEYSNKFDELLSELKGDSYEQL